jgi:hypothetical protein
LEVSLNLLAVQDQITNKLKELNQDVYDTAVPENVKITHGGSKLFLPYIVATYGDMTESSRGRGITSVRNNAGMSYAVIKSIAPTERAAREVAGLVRDKLLGFAPTDAGELRLAPGGRNYVDADGNGAPERYVAEIPFVFIVNTVVS